MTGRKLGLWGPKPNFVGHWDTALEKFIKLGLSWENQDKWDSYINVLVTI
jgi:hypothetical protein